MIETKAIKTKTNTNESLESPAEFVAKSDLKKQIAPVIPGSIPIINIKLN